MSALAEFEAYVRGLSAKDKAELDQIIAADLKSVWLPNPDNIPQTTAYHSKADLMLYGGAAGSGKTALLVGLAMTAHERSVIFRRQFGDLRGVEEYLLEVAGGRDGWNGSDKILRRPGRVVELGHLEKPNSEKAWQGRPHDLICVERNTPVLMAGGRWKPVQELCVGDLVETLEGPRAISKTFPPQFKEAVEVTAYDGDGRVIAHQVQGATHELLTSAGWACLYRSSSSRLSWFLRPIGFPFYRRALGLFAQPYVRSSCSHRGSLFHLRHIAGQWRALLASARSFVRAIFAFSAPRYAGNGCAEIDDSAQQSQRLPLSNGLQAPQEAVLRLGGAARKLLRSAFSYDVSDALQMSSLQDCLDHYLSGTRLCGEHTHGFSGHRSEPKVAQLYLHRSCDVARPIPNGSVEDVRDKTRGYSHHKASYAHPYKKEIRQTQVELHPCASFSVSEVGVKELYDLEVSELNHYITSGGFINKNCFDEGAQLARSKVQFVLGWLRSVTPGQRCRVVIASNPPTGGDGDWIVEWFAPWLDEKFPNPAKMGELRWAATAPNAEGDTIWLDSGDPIVFTEGVNYRLATAEEIAMPHDEQRKAGIEIAKPMTRTFIPGKLEDNPYLRDTGYRAQLQALPEPLRSQMLHGDFMAGRQDHEWQVIPTAWVKAAQARWTERPPEGVTMTALAADVAQGGADNFVVAPRFGPWYAPLVVKPGIETPRPSDGAALIVACRRNNAAVIVDMGGGYGGGVKERLEENGIKVRPFNGANESWERTADKQLEFRNKRAEAHWRFREALDPDQVGGSKIMLPLDPQLLADLTSVRWFMSSGGIQIESKEDLKKPDRLGRSPDKGDAVVMAWSEGEKAIIADIKRRERDAEKAFPVKFPSINGALATNRGTGWMAGR